MADEAFLIPARLLRRMPVVMLALSVLAQGCSGLSNDQTLVLPVTAGDVATPSYVRFLDSAVIDSTRLALVWVDNSDAGNRVWTCVVRRDAADRLEAASATTLIDTGSIMDAQVFADGSSYGVLYTKDLKLHCRRPWNKPSFYPLPSRPHMQAYSAINISGTIIIVGLILQTSGVNGYQCVAAAVGRDSTEVRVLGHLDMPRLRQQPSPQLFAAGDSIGVGVLLSWGSYTSVLPPNTSVGLANGDAGAFVLLRLFMEKDSLRAVSVASTTLPQHPDLAFARSFVLLDQAGGSIATSSSRVQLVAPFDTMAVLQQVSSPTGSGSNVARPRLQALPLQGGDNLLVWIDAAADGFAFDVPLNTVPSQFGSSIVAQNIHNGRLSEAKVRGFPIATHAQCIALQSLGGRPILAWARASDMWKGRRRLPNGICVRLLP